MPPLPPHPQNKNCMSFFLVSLAHQEFCKFLIQKHLQYIVQSLINKEPCCKTDVFMLPLRVRSSSGNEVIDYQTSEVVNKTRSVANEKRVVETRRKNVDFGHG